MIWSTLICVRNVWGWRACTRWRNTQCLKRIQRIIHTIKNYDFCRSLESFILVSSWWTLFICQGERSMEWMVFTDVYRTTTYQTSSRTDWVDQSSFKYKYSHVFELLVRGTCHHFDIFMSDTKFIFMQYYVQAFIHSYCVCHLRCSSEIEWVAVAIYGSQRPLHHSTHIGQVALHSYCHSMLAWTIVTAELHTVAGVAWIEFKWHWNAQDSKYSQIDPLIRTSD